MNRIFKYYLDKFVIMFINDILVYFRSKLKYEEYLQCVLPILRKEKLYAKLKKYEFWLDKIAFLRHIMSKDEISMDPIKVKALVQ